jgi:hypothetical protein
MICPWCDLKIPDNSKICQECGVEIISDGSEEENTSSLDCLRCDGQMESLGVQKIQLGKSGFFLGDLPNILAGALTVEIFKCNKCGKIELYSVE